MAMNVREKISEMPDEILSTVLQLLPMKEAARSSILSRKWRFRWKSSMAFCSSFSLDVLTMKGSDYPEDIFTMTGNEDEWYQNDNKVLSIESHKFIRWVQAILKLDYRPLMDTFRLRYYFEKDFASYIDEWIAFALSKRVELFDIDLSHFNKSGIRLPDEELYTFPHWLFLNETSFSVRKLSLKSCIFRPPIDFHVFSSLSDIQLENVLLNQDYFASFLSNCHNLENLSLHRCMELQSFKISGSSFQKLKYLAISNCYDLRSVDISANSLSKFNYCGTLEDFSIASVHQLSHATVDIHKSTDHSAALNSVLQKISSMPNLESLMLTVRPIKKLVIPRCFTNLKKLVLSMHAAYKETLWVLVPLLHAMSCLDMLELNWWLINCPVDCEESLKLKPPASPLTHLQDLTISGIFGSDHEIEFATYLLNNAPSLKKLLVYYKSKKSYSSKNSLLMCEIPREESAAQETKNQILDVLPPQVDFLFF